MLFARGMCFGLPIVSLITSYYAYDSISKSTYMGQTSWDFYSCSQVITRKQNKKFIYSTVKEGARARDYEDALTWLCNAGMAYKIFRSTKPGLPISAYDDLTAFKLYAVDTGLLRRLALLDPISFNEGTHLFTEFKGALTENFILQGLADKYEAIPRYWTSGGQAEVDFIIQCGNDIIPIEVKSDQYIINSRSHTLYGQKYQNDTKIRLRFSLRMDEKLTSDSIFVKYRWFNDFYKNFSVIIFRSLLRNLKRDGNLLNPTFSNRLHR